MVYNFTKITTVAKCDEMIAKAQVERFDQSSAVERYNYQIAQKAITITRVQNLLDEVTTRIDALTTQIDSMADGTDKDQLIAKRYSLLARQQRFTIALGDDSTDLDIDRQIALSQAEALVINIDERIAAFQAKKVEL